MGNNKIRFFLFGAVMMFLFVSIKTQAQNVANGKKYIRPDVWFVIKRMGVAFQI
jgi:hypothetical protein